jgi:hypothetical protein
LVCSAILCLPGPASGQQPCPYDGQPYGTEFEVILGNLIATYWDGGTGSWSGDLEDAPSFAPFVLYSRAADCSSADYQAKANSTIEYLVRISDAWLANVAAGSWEKGLYQVMAGHLGYFDAVKHYHGDPVTQAKAHLYLQAGTLAAGLAALILPQEILRELPLDVIAVLGIAADDNFTLTRTTGNPMYAALGQLVVERANAQFWVPGSQGGYYAHSPADPPWDWNQGYMLSALAEAYYATHDPRHRNRRDEVMNTMERLAWDPQRGGYYCSEFPTYCTGKGLSNNLVMMRGILKWRDVSGEPFYHARADAILQFIRNDLYYNALVYHDWYFSVGRAGWYCTGCNFWTLENIYYFNTRAIPTGHVDGATSLTGATEAGRALVTVVKRESAVVQSALRAKVRGGRITRDGSALFSATWGYLFRRLLKNPEAVNDTAALRRQLPGILRGLSDSLAEVPLSASEEPCAACHGFTPEVRPLGR